MNKDGYMNFWRIGLIVLMVGFLLFGTGIIGYAVTTMPDCTGPKVDSIINPEGDGNYKFDSVSPPCYVFKVDPATSGSKTFEGITINYEVYDNGELLRFWTEDDIPIVQGVIIKDGNMANLYDYSDDPVYNDCNLVSPGKANIPEISHFEFHICIPENGCLEVVKTWDDDALTPEEGITVNVYKSSDDSLAGEIVLTADDGWTDILCNLVAGEEYYIEEEAVDNYTVSYPDGISAEVPFGETITLRIVNMLDYEAETAWAAHEEGELPYNMGKGGNWATYVEYEYLVEYDNKAIIYAGQNMEAGYALFTDLENGNMEIEIFLVEWAFEPDTTNLYVQDYTEAPKGNPAPGRFEYKKEATISDNIIIVPFNYFYGVHLNVYEIK